jgi:predicted metal-dependent hydrolase
MRDTTNRYDANTQLQTLNFKVIFVVSPKLKNQLSTKLENGILAIRYSPDFNFQLSSNQDVIKNIVKKYLTDDAKEYLPKQLKYIAEKHNFKFNKVKINSARQRLGSCNSIHNINLSCYLLLYSSQLIDYVITHELCHTKQLNHSSKFYDELGKIIPNVREFINEITSASVKLKGFY